MKSAQVNYVRFNLHGYTATYEPDDYFYVTPALLSHWILPEPSDNVAPHPYPLEYLFMLPKSGIKAGPKLTDSVVLQHRVSNLIARLGAFPDPDPALDMFQNRLRSMVVTGQCPLAFCFMLLVLFCAAYHLRLYTR
ncbi:hypothetical protein B0H10DRAFT_1950843 [Mycena sp. CBHHK59/15]|nr:hypothetical protein B0H10DRAFT_1962479 [Mycena sp. CBHHK59/15]KAJ6614196.1 hypothetical protein B0H10DRAFT_1950843 [Mycena sp. CBHHK59/15]